MSKSTGARARRPAEQREGSSRDGLTEDTSAELSPAGEKIVAAFRETIQSMQSGEPPENRFTASTNTWVDDQITKNELGHEVPKEVAS
ncbi:MAG TPA: hypothetical protein VF590_09175, partial [Isosphaeraceae bacterium]